MSQSAGGGQPGPPPALGKGHRSLGLRERQGTPMAAGCPRCPAAARGQGRRRSRCPRAADRPGQHTRTHGHIDTHTHRHRHTRAPGTPEGARPKGSRTRPARRDPQLSPALPYLPIIVECCCTAASSSLSRIVHSPIAVHPETKTLASAGDLFTSAFFHPSYFFLFFSPGGGHTGEDEPVCSARSRRGSAALPGISGPPGPARPAGLGVREGGRLPLMSCCL